MSSLPDRPYKYAQMKVLIFESSLPLITISIVRTISFTIYSSTKRILNSTPLPSEPPKADHKPTDDARPSNKDGSSRKTPWINIQLGWFSGDNAKDIGITSFLAGAVSGAVVCVGSAPFELVKVGTKSSTSIELSLIGGFKGTETVRIPDLP